MNNMYGLGTYGANSFVDTFFGTSSTRGGSLLSSIGDLQMIQKLRYSRQWHKVVWFKEFVTEAVSGSK